MNPAFVKAILKFCTTKKLFSYVNIRRFSKWMFCREAEAEQYERYEKAEKGKRKFPLLRDEAKRKVSPMKVQPAPEKPTSEKYPLEQSSKHSSLTKYDKIDVGLPTSVMSFSWQQWNSQNC